MTRYEVTAWVGKITVEVDAKDEEDAIAVALAEWLADDVFAAASYEVREIGE